MPSKDRSLMLALPTIAASACSGASVGQQSSPNAGFIGQTSPKRAPNGRTDSQAPSTAYRTVSAGQGPPAPLRWPLTLVNQMRPEVGDPERCNLFGSWPTQHAWPLPHWLPIAHLCFLGPPVAMEDNNTTRGLGFPSFPSSQTWALRAAASSSTIIA